MSTMARTALVLLFTFATSAWCSAAEGPPAPGAPPDHKPGPPSATPQPDQVPSPRDPGIVKQPETVGPPGSVVTPPVVDPKMAVNPEEPQTGEAAPPRSEPAPPPAPSK